MTAPPSLFDTDPGPAPAVGIDAPRPRLLDLFCGGGGAAMGYHRVGFDVVGIDNKRRPDYPFEFVQADAMTYPLEGFDAVHASPPCKRWTVANRVHGSGPAHDDLLTPTLARLRAAGLPWIVENVPGAPMPPDTVTLCGSHFGLTVRRHRLFAASFELVAPPCRHDLQPHVVGVYGTGGNWTRTAPGGGGRKVSGQAAADALGIDWTANQAVLSQAIPPAYAEFLGAQLLDHLNR